MNLKHLETFHFFCKFRSMSRTADWLNVTQPAVSQQLSAFQAECGVKLFYRQAGEYRLTETGEEIYLISQRILSRVAQIEDLLEKTRNVDLGRLRIGTTKTFARTIMPDLVARFQERHPKVTVHLSEGNSADLIKRLCARQEDLAVVARSQYDPSIRALPFARCEVVLVARPDHPLVEDGPVSIAALNGEPMIIRERGSGLRNAIVGKLGRHGVTPSMLVESESLSFILAYIERREGLAFLLSHEIGEELATGALRTINLKEGGLSFESDIVVRRNEPLSVPIRSFLKIVRDHPVVQALRSGADTERKSAPLPG